MIIEHVENAARDLANLENQKPRRWNRASSIGRCPRELGFEKLIADWCARNPGRSALDNEYGIKREPLTPRRQGIFDRGDYYDGKLKNKIHKACPWTIPIEYGSWPSVLIEGQEITGTPDMVMLPHGDYKTCGLIELKSMSDFAYDRAINGEIDLSYQCQAWIYAVPNDLNPIVFVCVRKHTEHIIEIVFDRNAKETIVTKRYGGNELEIAIDDPLLMAEVRSPFDEGIESRVRETIQAVNEASSIGTLPRGTRTVEPESINIQGKEKAAPLIAQYGEPEKSGSWYKFKTGRQILGFPCSYCQFKENCFPGAKMEINGGQPKWLM